MNYNKNYKNKMMQFKFKFTFHIKPFFIGNRTLGESLYKTERLKIHLYISSTFSEGYLRKGTCLIFVAINLIALLFILN